MRKLGLRPSPHDERTLKVERYLGAVPPPPSKVNFGTGVGTLSLFANDKVGDCALASTGHLMQVWTKNAKGSKAYITNKQILSAYSAVTGYDPKDPSTDQGSRSLDVMRYWRKTGIAGRQVLAFAGVNPKNASSVRQALWAFGGLYLGWALPITAQDQKVWDVVGGGGESAEPNSWGGHATSVHAFTPDGFEIASWGKRYKVTNAFFEKYCQEVYAVISTDWLKGTESPNGFDLKELQADLGKVAS